MKLILTTIIFFATFLASSCNKLFSQACAYDMGPSIASIATVVYSFVDEKKPVNPPKRSLNYIMINKKQPPKPTVVKPPPIITEQENSQNSCVNGSCYRPNTYNYNSNVRTRYLRIFR